MSDSDSEPETAALDTNIRVNNKKSFYVFRRIMEEFVSSDIPSFRISGCGNVIPRVCSLAEICRNEFYEYNILDWKLEYMTGAKTPVPKATITIARGAPKITYDFGENWGFDFKIGSKGSPKMYQDWLINIMRSCAPTRICLKACGNAISTACVLGCGLVEDYPSYKIIGWDQGTLSSERGGREYSTTELNIYISNE